MLPLLSAFFIAVVAMYFVGFGAACYFAPSTVERFLKAFAGSARVHYAELMLRMLAGGALIVRAPAMPGAVVFETFGWILIATTAGLACLPWRWHRRIAEQAVPKALRHIALIGAVALAAGAGLIVALTVEAGT